MKMLHVWSSDLLSCRTNSPRLGPTVKGNLKIWLCLQQMTFCTNHFAPSAFKPTGRHLSKLLRMKKVPGEPVHALSSRRWPPKSWTLHPLARSKAHCPPPLHLQLLVAQNNHQLLLRQHRQLNQMFFLLLLLHLHYLHHVHLHLLTTCSHQMTLHYPHLHLLHPRQGYHSLHLLQHWVLELINFPGNRQWSLPDP